MGYYSAIISGIIKTIGAFANSGGPNYPDPPKLHKLPVQEAKRTLEDYEGRRMQASIDAWKEKFPLLYKGGQYEVNDIMDQQKGMLGGHIAADMERSGLGPVREGDQYALSRDIGLSPITLSQRTSQAVTRQMANNPEWTNKITGGTLATMLANNYQNQQAYGMFINSNNTARSIAGQAGSLYNTQALLGAATGAARVGSSIYQNNYGPLSPAGQGAFQTNPNANYAGSVAPPPTMTPPASYPPTSAYTTYSNNLYGSVEAGPVTTYNPATDFNWLYQSMPDNYVQDNPYGNI